MAYNPISLNTGLGFSKHSELVVARVRNVVLSPYLDDGKTLNEQYNSPNDIGKIVYDILYQNRQALKGDNANRPAWPIFSFIKQYPVIGEIVLVILGPSADMNDSKGAQAAYYFPPYNLWNSVNHNVFPELAEYADFLNRYYQKPNYQYANTGSLPELPKGAYFSEKPIKTLSPFEGDTIVEGRFGQSIRFGSTSTKKKFENNWSNTGNDGAPITIIRNGQGSLIRNGKEIDTRIVQVDERTAKFADMPGQPTIENINFDHSSIYLTSGQEININGIPSEFPMESYTMNVTSSVATSTTNLEQIPRSNETVSAMQNDNRP
jgi:hypothetical protein